jgi:cold-inducible RNA-binding protein
VNIFVGNFPFETTEDELRTPFAEHGEVASVQIMREKHSGESRGFAFVEMPVLSEAREAVSKLNESDFKGRNLNVSEARPKPRLSFDGHGHGHGHGHGGPRRRDSKRKGSRKGGSKRRSKWGF